MYTWKDYPAWLGALQKEIPDDLKTPQELAAFEAASFLEKSGLDGKVRFQVSGKGDGFQISRESRESDNGAGYLISGGVPGVLYGVYSLIGSLLLGEAPEKSFCEPEIPYRILNCWDNMDGSIERGYAGRSLWFEGNRFSYEPERIRQLGRMLASVGINVLCINNVNVHEPAQQLLTDLLPDAAKFASILRPFGIRLMFSIDFSLPSRSGAGTADPLDPAVQEWWSRCAERVWTTIPDFAGFLVKADSEHRPGPNTYGRTHADGANMLADAIAPYGGILVWRAFVYNCMQDWRDSSVDRPCAAYEIYKPLDGLFHDNVILQVKYGPFDFQVREPISPLFLGMKQTSMAMELQLAQEYTGQQIDIFAMPPMWRELFDQLFEGQLHSERQIGSPDDSGVHKPFPAISAVSNLGRDADWTGHPFAALNLFAFGIYAWNSAADPEIVIRRWIRLTYDLSSSQQEILYQILAKSREVYEKYTAPLGLCWMVSPERHYGPSPYGYEFMVWGTYNRADRDAVGIDRTASGTGYVLQYPDAVRKLYEDPETCPDDLLLFFHRLPYSFRMKDGRSLIQRIYDDHFEGYEEAAEMSRKLETLPLPESDQKVVMHRMELQLKNAAEWRDVVNTFFKRFSGIKDEKNRRIWP